EMTLSIQSDYASAYNQRGLIAQEGQQYEAATAAFKKAFELDPCETGFSYKVGWSLLEELKFDDSEQWAWETNELPRSKLRGIKPPLAYTRVPPVWRGDIRVACAP